MPARSLFSGTQAWPRRVALRLVGNHHAPRKPWSRPGKTLLAFSTWPYGILTRRAPQQGHAEPLRSLDPLGNLPSPGGGTAERVERNLGVDTVTNALAALPFSQRSCRTTSRAVLRRGSPCDPQHGPGRR
jgi:hypothetical protein